jgi:hypothetical protein
MTIKVFWGDYEHDDQQDLLQAFEQLFLSRTNIMDTEKLHVFRIHLKSGSEADQWWGNLGTQEKSTWKDLSLASRARWPQNATADTSQFTYSHDEVEQLLTTARLKGYNEGFEEGRGVGITETEMLREMEMASRVDMSTQTTDTGTINSSTQTMPMLTVNADMQTVTYDKLPRLLRNAGTSTDPPNLTNSLTPLSLAASSLTMVAQPPSTLPMLLTMATTMLFPAPKLPPASQK